MVGGHMITIVSGKRPKTYVVGESDLARAVEALRRHMGTALSLPINPLPVSQEILGEHGIRSGQVKLLHL